MNIRESPAQEKTKEKINTLNSQITSLTELRNSGFSSVSREEIKDVISEKKKNEKKLKKLQKATEYQKKSRMKRKEKLKKVCEMNPGAKNILKSMMRENPGRPRIGKKRYYNI